MIQHRRGTQSLPGRDPYSSRARSGDHVYDVNDPRHDARLEAIEWGVARVRFIDTGMLGEIGHGDLRKVGEKPWIAGEVSPWCEPQ
jgi:hypothetical protein